ncbi:hypothetical protein CSPB12327_03245 [Campylobacter sp. RM12327]|nr:MULTISPECIES: hypothetical protein [Campylobacter]MBE7357538.1 hypothetical protein [Campylobacter sp. RM11302]MBF6669161.1 hypothetical protein [Campylobacter sp. RM12327]MBF6674363.1 hypothetical protein [Campylobacter sp. RM13538]MBF6675404.1 hypothetical protein [Campylobacter sp. RM12321]MBF6677048.1 hypothetical protein [Campylobacter sp. RM11259]
MIITIPNADASLIAMLNAIKQSDEIIKNPSKFKFYTNIDKLFDELENN